jgi:hypothetical protein
VPAEGYEADAPVGMQTFLRPGFTAPIVEPEGTSICSMAS